MGAAVKLQILEIRAQLAGPLSAGVDVVTGVGQDQGRLGDASDGFGNVVIEGGVETIQPCVSGDQHLDHSIVHRLNAGPAGREFGTPIPDLEQM